MNKINLIDLGNTLEAYRPKFLIPKNNTVFLMRAIPRGFEFDRHNFEETVIVLSGEFIIEMPSQIIKIKSNESYTIPMGMLHKPQQIAEAIVLVHWNKN